MVETGYTIRPIRVIRSELASRKTAPFQGYEGGRDENRPLTGVFTTRSPDRPNPLGLHRVTVREICGNRLRVGPIEAIDGTPLVDIKPMFPRSADS